VPFSLAGATDAPVYQLSLGAGAFRSASTAGFKI
jgi:hypothetical protein